jgi:hypothetical protein
VLDWATRRLDCAARRLGGKLAPSVSEGAARRLKPLDQVAASQAVEVFLHVGEDLGSVPLAQGTGDLGDRARSVAQLEDRLAGVVDEHRPFGIQQRRALPDPIVADAGEPPEAGIGLRYASHGW